MLKNRILGSVEIYLLFLFILLLQKPLFMLFNRSLYADAGWAEWGRVIGHGLPHDLSIAAYLTVVPMLLSILSVWTGGSRRRLGAVLYLGAMAYLGVVALAVAMIFVVNANLYRYWGFPLDATPLFYFFSSPKDALASITAWQIAGGTVAILLYASLFFGCFRCLLTRSRHDIFCATPQHRMRTTLVQVVLLLLLFIPIRGGFTVATMNVGQVYFSTDMRLNHAAVNPAFSLMESLSKQKDFAAQYRFISDADAHRLMRSLVDTTTVSPSAADRLFTLERPDVYIFILESFSSHLMATLGGRADTAVCLDSLAREGVLFTRFYANSFRTDRGVVAILSGYPAQPTTSIMKYPHKSQSLPSIAGTLRNAGYEAHYYYGGDANFTNMRSYLMASGFQSIVSDKDFPVSERLSKWGVHDHLVFRRLLQALKATAADNNGNDNGAAATSPPVLRVLQTSSSHEPFDVPYRRLKDDRLNAFAYTDSVVGDFISQLRTMPQWKRSVVLLVPDHLGCYPENISNFTETRYQIPLIITGGAVRAPRRIDTYGSQQDIAATLLAQLGLPHTQFTFSKDLLNPASPHFAFFTVPDAFGMVTPDNTLIYDCATDKVVVDEGACRSANLLPGKAYLQSLYDDLAKR
jgi:phosphoglycerol transferase MdoB-like AlkP superfamily enzyme